MNNKDARRLIEQIGVQGFIKLIKQYDLPELIEQFKQVGTQTDIK
jgi:hypothetical protein